MRVSELILALEEFKAVNGDLLVYTTDVRGNTPDAARMPQAEKTHIQNCGTALKKFWKEGMCKCRQGTVVCKV